MATSTATPTLPTKSDSEPTVDEKEKKHPVRNVAQPAGTIVYTVDKSDTLTSIAARFETTPSELVKINRLVNRLIFPGKILFVPEKSVDSKDTMTNTSPKNGPKDLSSASSMPNGSGVLPNQGSPKPGHVERIQSPPLSPSRSGLFESQFEEVVDRVHTQKFLKINVKHITDGQGVVSGVLLVTPNAVMFDPSVVDTLVMEHGADKYGVIAPMDYVANAALYTDIAHMRVKHAKQNALPHPEIYHAKSCPMYKELGNESEASEVVAAQPSRSESQQAVKGSVSDKAELSDEDDDDDDGEGEVDDGVRGDDAFGGGSVCSCQTGSKGSGVQSPDDNSEVFVEDDASVLLENSKVEISHRVVEKVEEIKTLASSTAVSFDSMETEAGLKKDVSVNRVPSESSGPLTEEPVTGTVVESAQTSDSDATRASEPVSVVIVVEETKKVDGELRNGQLPSAADAKESVSCRPSLVPFVVEGLKSLSQSALTLREEGVSQIASGRKHSIPEAQVSTEKMRLKMLKRLSYPLWSTDSYESKDKEDLGATSVPKSPLESGQTTISKILTSASPKNLVDFSTGIFLKSADCVGKVADVSQLPKMPPSWIAPPSPSLDGWVETTKNLLTGRRGSTSPDTLDVCEARNYSVLDYGPYGAKADGKRSSRGSREETRVEFKNEVADKLELFQTLETIGSIPEDFELIPRPARSCEDPPLYLCLRMGSPLYKKVMSTTPIMSYGQHKMKSEYWFSIPKDRVDDLYRFFQHWAPGVYGDINQVDLKERGFQLVEPDDDQSDDDDDESRDVASKSSGEASGIRDSKGNDDHDTAANELHSWEIIKAPYQRLFGRLRRETQSSDSEVVSIQDVPEQDDMRQMSLDLDMLIPELISPTEIMDEDHRRSISKSLPARAQGYAWSLIFSASQHGFSLQSMYRRMAKFETPVLLVIQDTNNNVFGAVTSCTLKVSDHFYGTGESFLYSFYPEFKVFKWTGENVFFIKGNPESLAIGAGDGVFGLWLDGDLYHGRSHCCKTYNNDMLTSSEDFCVKMLEAWGFVEFGVMDSNC